MKPNQLLISITPRDLSFVVEENLSDIFGLFAARNVRIDLMQNSAVAFSVAVDDTPRARGLIEELGRSYEVRYNDGCELVTVRHFDEATLAATDRRTARAHRAAEPEHGEVRGEVNVWRQPSGLLGAHG